MHDVLWKTSPGMITGLPDKRGKQPAKNKVDRNLINQHISTFNPSVSHYRREHAPNRKYLPGDVTVRLMHEDFKEKNPDLICSYDLYRAVVKENNISFAILGNEECEVCETFKFHDKDHSKENLNNECDDCKSWSIHLERVKIARLKYKECSENTLPLGTICYSADLMKVVMLPRVDVFKSVLFTKRIIAFNESFAPVGTCQQKETPFAAIWNEAINGRHCEDIISAFHAFMLEKRDAKKIILFLDNCAAQNKNWSLISYFTYLINSDLISAEEIELNYLERGHTFMSADSFHHQVEMSMKRMQKVYDYNDYSKAVQEANCGKVQVKNMKPSDFFDWQDHSSTYRINKINPRPYLKTMMQILFCRDSLSLHFRDNFSSPLQEVKFLKTSVEKTGSFKEPQAKQDYRGVSQEKKTSIIKNLVGLMPKNRREFWLNLPVAAVPDLIAEF